MNIIILNHDNSGHVMIMADVDSFDYQDALFIFSGGTHAVWKKRKANEMVSMMENKTLC